MPKKTKLANSWGVFAINGKLGDQFWDKMGNVCDFSVELFAEYLHTNRHIRHLLTEQLLNSFQLADWSPRSPIEGLSEKMSHII